MFLWCLILHDLHFAGLASALISSSFDQDPSVKKAIMVSLSNFGNKKPDLVLTAIYNFLITHPKVLINNNCERIDLHINYLLVFVVKQ